MTDRLNITSDRTKLDLAMIHRYLSQDSYWWRGVTFNEVARAIDHSLCFAGFLGDEQIAFGRVVTDQTTFAYLCDVFVLPDHQGKGYSKQLMSAIMAHPDLQNLRRFYLGTLDAHRQYRKFLIQ